jgi:hypothetical protein
MNRPKSANICVARGWELKHDLVSSINATRATAEEFSSQNCQSPGLFDLTSPPVSGQAGRRPKNHCRVSWVARAEIVSMGHYSFMQDGVDKSPEPTSWKTIIVFSNYSVELF